ncbi:hypothetical protein KQI63_05865 [bacterium]|nr:hypothetical protein [bacterium]
MDQAIRKKIFGHAIGAWPELKGPQRTDEIRAICAELNDGVFSLSALPDGLAQTLLNRIKQIAAERRKQLRREWDVILDGIPGASDQLCRMVEIAHDIDWTPNRVLALIRKERGGTETSWDFPPDSSELRKILPILESYRRKQRTWYFDRDSGKGKPRPHRRRRARR